VRLGHLNLRVVDVEACRAFYCAHFGFQSEFEAEGGHFLRGAGGFLLALVPAPRHVEMPEGFHVGFVASSPSDLEEKHQSLVDAGVRSSAIEDHRSEGDDYISFRCADPDGTEIEIYWDGR
jgi:catechol 2,3-dioxygenase-like lactoylglutathione lyase family enzyme